MACGPVLGHLGPRALRNIVGSNRPSLRREDGITSVQPYSARVCGIMFAVLFVERGAMRGLGQAHATGWKPGINARGE